MNKPELISFSDFLMIAPYFDQRTFFRPEIENIKGGIEGLMLSGLITKEENPLIDLYGSVAVLKIEGPLRPGRDWYFSVGYGDIQDAIQELKEDTRIKTVIQKIDSPGGTVKQAFETEEMFRELAQVKTLISLITGSATSAAALMTFPAKQRFLATKTAQTGSIGVVAQHIDNRIWYQEFLGEIRTSIAKGRLKDAGTDVRAYDEKAKEVFDKAVGKLHEIFTESAAVGLGVSREKIEAQESAVFIGTEGIEQGFADGFATLDDLIEQSKASTVFSMPGRPALSTHSEENNRMDINKLKAEHLEVYNQVLALGRAEGSPALKETHQNEGKAMGAIEERKRISGIKALALPGQAELMETMIEDGSTEADAAVKFLAAQKASLAAIKTNIEGDLNDPLASDVPTDVKPPESDAKDLVAEYDAAVLKAQDGGKVSKGAAMKFVKTSQPELHAAFINKSNEKGE